MEILEKEMGREDMPLHDDEKNLLRTSLKTGRFKQGVEIVRKALRKRDEMDAEARLEDI